MSASLHLRGVSAAYGERELFADLTLTVSAAECVGLVGPNGAGKSTILAMMAGLHPPARGSIVLSPADARVGYLTQQPSAAAGETIRGHILRRAGISGATAALERAAADLADESAESGSSYSAALETWLALGGADAEERLEVVAADLGLRVDLDREVAALSGGQTARVSLAGLLLSRFDVFLLDEPTNDLDLAGLEVLEEFVLDLQAPCVVVSHDREFLSRTVTSVVDIDRSLQQVSTYGGSYDAYLEERSIARRHARESYEAYQARKNGLEERARRQRAWMDKGTRNALRKKRTRSERDKFVRAHAVASSEKQAAKARQTQRLLERLEVVAEPRKEWQLEFSIASAPRSGDIVAVASGALVTRGSFTFGPVDLQVDLGDRVAITGPNGSGKSTLLALITGGLAPTRGRVTRGTGVVVGEVDQARSAFESTRTLGRSFEEEVPDWSHAQVRTLLAKFGLGADHVGRLAHSLSPGERTRAALALLQARGINLLVLDEPTNHLDLQAIEQIEQAIDAFDGTVLLVTHDRRMLESVRLTRRWDVNAGRVEEISPDQG